VTQAEVNTARQVLTAEISKARLRANISLLAGRMIALKSADLALYTTDSVRPLEEAMGRATGIIEDPDVYQETVDAMLDELNTLYNALALRPEAAATPPPSSDTSIVSASAQTPVARDSFANTTASNPESIQAVTQAPTEPADLSGTEVISAGDVPVAALVENEQARAANTDLRWLWILAIALTAFTIINYILYKKRSASALK
jgi:hypothetical protein